MGTDVLEVGACLTAARQILTERGWCRDKYEADAENRTPSEREGAVCLVGAVNRTGLSRAVINEAVAALEVEAGAPILPWNDAPGRTLEQILGLLDQTIQRVKNRARVLAMGVG